jgi:hypothetical protein
VGLDEGADVVFQLLDGRVDPAPYLFVGDQGKEPLDLIDPRCPGWREVDVPSRALCQPIADELGLVGGVIVHDEVNLKVGRHIGFDPVEELAKLSGPVLWVTVTDDAARGDVEGSKQRCSAMAGVVMSYR